MEKNYTESHTMRDEPKTLMSTLKESERLTEKLQALEYMSESVLDKLNRTTGRIPGNKSAHEVMIEEHNTLVELFINTNNKLDDTMDRIGSNLERISQIID